MAVAGLPTLLLPRKAVWGLVRLWARWNIFLLKYVADIRFEIRGLEHIPAGGCLVAAKHQSVFETFALIPYFKDPAFVLKRELNWLPLFGWYAMKCNMIAVNRGARAKALRDMTLAAKHAVDKGRQIIIFPEGTRTAPGAAPRYKYGLTHLYGQLNVPCVPVALNSGVYWPRRTFLKYPGTIIITILPAFPAGMELDAFHGVIQERIETASNGLLH